MAAGVVLGIALGWRGLAVLAAAGIALLIATTAGVDPSALWAKLGEYWATLTDYLTREAVCATRRMSRLSPSGGCGPFRSVSELTRVSGIATARLRDIVAQGLACVR